MGLEVAGMKFWYETFNSEIEIFRLTESQGSS